MVKVKFTSHLKRRINLPDVVEMEGQTVKEIVDGLEARFKGIRGYIVDERGAMRQHVNIFVGDAPIKDRAGLSDSVEQKNEIFIMQALSGG